MRRALLHPLEGLAAAFALAVTLIGCTNTATLHTARPIEPESTDFGLALGLFRFEENEGGDAYGYAFEAQVRRGIHERLDVGLQATNLGTLSVDANYALLLTEDHAVSIDPTILLSQWWYAGLPIHWDFLQTSDLTLTASLHTGRFWIDFADNEADFLFDGLDRDAWLYGAGLAGRYRLTESLDVVAEIRATWVEIEETGDRLRLPTASLGFVF